MRRLLALDLLRQSLRVVLRRPRFAIAAMLLLGVAVALNTTIYAVFDALVTPNVSMRAPGQLYRLRCYCDYRNRVDMRTNNDILVRALGEMLQGETGQEAIFPVPIAEHGPRHHDAVVTVVPVNYFTVLGVAAAQGRLLGAGDLNAANTPIVISERLAAELFAGESPVGGSLTLDGVPATVLGVIARESVLPGDPGDVWRLPPPTFGTMPINLIRLKDGVTPQQAYTKLQVLAATIARLAGETVRDNRFDMKPAVRSQFALRKFDLAIAGAVLAVLLVACANLANLQLARGTGRARELATRAAVGASRRQLVTQLLLESGWLALGGLFVGTILTLWGVHLLRAAVPPTVGAYIVEPQTSWRVFTFAAAVTCVALLLVGLVPAIRVSRVDVNEVLKTGAGTGTFRGSRRQYGVLVVAEIALALAVVAGAGLLVRAATVLYELHLGYDSRPLLGGWLMIAPPAGKTMRTVDALNEIVAHMRAVPGVRDAAAYHNVRMVGDAMAVDDPGGPPVELPMPLGNYAVVTSGFFRTMQIPILRGRDFGEGESAEPVVILDERAARQLWRNSDPIGRRLKLGAAQTKAPWLRVVGISRHISLQANPAAAAEEDTTKLDATLGTLVANIWVLVAADTSHLRAGHGLFTWVVARGGRDAARLPVAIRSSLRDVTWLRPPRLVPWEQLIRVTQLRQSHDFVAAMFSIFAVFTLGLAALGIYAVIAQSLEHRRRELGVRIALGASPRHVLAVVFREGNVLALLGVAIGLVLARWGAGLLGAFLFFEEDVYDAPYFAVAALFTFAVALVASYVPARRATRIDPVESLRSE